MSFLVVRNGFCSSSFSCFDCLLVQLPLPTVFHPTCSSWLVCCGRFILQKELEASAETKLLPTLVKTVHKKSKVESSGSQFFLIAQTLCDFCSLSSQFLMVWLSVCVCVWGQSCRHRCSQGAQCDTLERTCWRQIREVWAGLLSHRWQSALGRYSPLQLGQQQSSPPITPRYIIH